MINESDLSELIKCYSKLTNQEKEKEIQEKLKNMILSLKELIDQEVIILPIQSDFYDDIFMMINTLENEISQLLVELSSNTIKNEE